MVRRVPVSRPSRLILWTSSTWAVTICRKQRRTMFRNSMPVAKAVKTWAVVSSTHSPHHRISRIRSEMMWFEVCQLRRLDILHKLRVKVLINNAKLIFLKALTFVSQPILIDMQTTVAATVETTFRRIPTLSSFQTYSSIKIWWVPRRLGPECHRRAAMRWTILVRTLVRRPCDFGRRWPVTRRACRTHTEELSTILKIWPKIDEK